MKSSEAMIFVSGFIAQLVRALKGRVALKLKLSEGMRTSLIDRMLVFLT